MCIKNTSKIIVINSYGRTNNCIRQYPWDVENTSQSLNNITPNAQKYRNLLLKTFQNHVLLLQLLVNLISRLLNKVNFVSHFHYKTIRRYNWNIVCVLNNLNWYDSSWLSRVEQSYCNQGNKLLRGVCSFHCMLCYTCTCQLFTRCSGDSRGRVVDGFITTCVISVYHQ